MKREAFEAIHGRLGGNVMYIDLDEQQEPPEPKTAGWTDTQIKAKPMSEIEAMIKTGEMGLESLRETLTKEEDRVSGLRRIRSRKTEVGGN